MAATEIACPEVSVAAPGGTVPRPELNCRVARALHLALQSAHLSSSLTTEMSTKTATHMTCSSHGSPYFLDVWIRGSIQCSDPCVFSNHITRNFDAPKSAMEGRPRRIPWGGQGCPIVALTLPPDMLRCQSLAWNIPEPGLQEGNGWFACKIMQGGYRKSSAGLVHKKTWSPTPSLRE